MFNCMVIGLTIGDFQEAIAKYEVVTQNLEFARDLQKQFQSIGNDVSLSDCNKKLSLLLLILMPENFVFLSLRRR